MMKAAKPSTLKVPRRDGKSSIRRSKNIRHRGVALNLESLEQRTLLSLSSAADATSSSSASAKPVTLIPVSSTENLPSALQKSVADMGTIATVVAPSSTNPTSAVSAAASHIYTGQPTNFGPVYKATSNPSSGYPDSGPDKYDPAQQAALTALSGTMIAQPQFLVMPTSGSKLPSPDDFTGPAGYGPAQIAGAYGINDVTFNDGIKGTGAGQTIAVVDLGDASAFVNSTDPNFGSSALAVFDQKFGLPDPPSFTKYNEEGQTSPLPPVADANWVLEISLDVEWAHAMAPSANIDLVESNLTSFADLVRSSNTAATILGASVVSQSWGALELELGSSYELELENTYYAPALASNPNVTFLAATGDGSAANGPIFPSVSPLNVAVGGTTLSITGDTYEGETAWADGGGGPSAVFPLPSYQQNVSGFDFGPLTTRTTPDISADANPETGVSVYEPEFYGGWVQVGGTSVATPITAATIGIADQGRVALGGQPMGGPTQTLPALYAAYESPNAYTPNTGYFNDITSGNNFYQAGPGYDLATGIGSEQAENLLPYLSLYDLGPVVISSDPASGEVVTGTPPTNFSLKFSQPIDPSTVVASDFTVNGIPADSDSLSADDTTIYYSFTSSPVINQGVETMDLPADSVAGEVTGQGNVAFSSSFFYAQIQLQVVSTSPPVGSVFTIPGNIDLVVHFNEAVDPYSITTSIFEVSQGTVASAVPLTPESVDLTITGVTQDGTLTLTIPPGALTDQYGVPSLGFTGTYVTDIVSEPYPTPLVGQPPAGSLIYDPTVSGTVGFVGDTDTYTLALAAGQQLSLALTVDSSLIGTVTLEGPGGTTIGSATGAGPGSTVVLESAPIATAGIYSLIVGGSGGTTGAYTLQAILNAVYKPSTLNISTIGTAFDLSSSFEGLGTTPYADRAGVVGTLGPVPSDFYAITLTAGEYATIADKGTSGTASLALYDGSGDLLADGTSGTGVDSIISDFVAQSSGTYYAEVTGATGLSYDLVAVRGGAFDLHGGSFAKAQPLNGAGVVLGAITKSSGSLYVLDDQLYSTYNPIYPTDPTTGNFTGPSIPQPGSPLNNPFGLNLAYDGTNLYFNDGPEFGNNEIYEINPSTGAVLNQFLPQEPYYLWGIAYFKGDLWATDSVNIYELDPTSGAVLQEFPEVFPSGNVTGLTADPDDGMLYAVSQFHTLYEIDPTTGAIVNSAPDNAQGLNEQDMAYAGGVLIVSDTNGLASSGGTNVLDEYDPSTLGFIQRLPVPVQGFVSGLGGDGLGGGNADWYSFNVNAGDSLVISTTTPGAPSSSGLQFANDLAPTINLYDASGNLVATATGNAPDGINDIIDYVATTPGSYELEIDGSSKTNIGEYTISVQGDTGGLAPFTVTSTNPAAGSDLGYQVSTMDVSFSSSVLLSSISDSDFTIDGNDATGVTLENANTVIFTFPTTSNGIHNVSISGVENLQGTVMTPDSFSFETDDIPPIVVSSSIADGAVLSPGPLTEVITFNEPIQPASANDSDIELFGEVRGVEYAPSSISFDPTDTILTITYSSLPSDAYQFILLAGPSNFLSTAGVPLQNNFVINFTMPAGTTTLTGLQPVLPLGSLVYESTIDNVLLTSSDSDTYDLTIDPHQTLSVVATPVTPGMSVTVTLISPAGIVIGTATSPTAGAPAVLPGVQSSKGGTYEIVITGGPGEYTVEPVLNAYIDPAAYGGPSNNSIATATPIDPYANKFAGNDDRTAVLGEITGSKVSFGDALVVQGVFGETGLGNVLLIDKNTGNVLDTYTSPDFSDLILLDVALAPDNTFYVLGDLNFFTGVIVHMNLQGQTLGEFTMPVSDPGTYISPEGFGLDPTDGSFWVPLINSATVVHVSSSGSLLGSFAVGSDPDDAAVGPDGNIYISQLFSGEVTQLNPSTGVVSFFASSPEPVNLTWSAAGDLWVGDFEEGVEEFNSSGSLIGLYGTFGSTAGEPALSGNVWNTNIEFDSVFQFASDGSQLTSTFFEPEQPGLAVLGDVPGEQPLTPPATPTYSFSLDQGESATIVIQSLTSDPNISFTLLDDEGDVLGYSSPDASNYTAGLSDFVAPADGTYYVMAAGDAGVQFNLVVTRGADFNTRPNNQSPTGQDITATEQSGDNKLGGVLGYLQNTNDAVGTDYYSVNANAGDNLAFTTTTPAGGPGEFINNLYPELLLYDPNGNLVAVAAGNAPDGRNSVIDFTVPEGDAGAWTIEVTPSPNTPLPTFGEYGLLVTGATGTLSPFFVTGSTPAAGALVQPPTDIIITFNDPVLGTSLTPGELEVNGVAATAVTLVNANTVDWTVPSSAYATGIDLPNVVTIGADALGNQVTDVSGQTLTPYSYTFFTTNVAPVVVSSSIDGQVFSPAPADVTEVVTFSQPMDTSFTTQSSFSLEGNFLNVSYAAASFSWDPTDTILTINYVNLPNDTYTLTLFASGFENTVGIPLANNYVANFSVALGTASFTGTFTPVDPLGSLIYTATEDPVLVDSTDIDYLTVSLNAGESLTLVGVPTTPSLQLWLTVLDPNSNVVAYTSAPAPGANAVIETAPVATTGTYTIVVYDVNGNVGQYSLQATLNAFVKTGTSNDTIATAQDLTGTSYVLGSGGGVNVTDRLGAVGSLPNYVSTGDVYVSSETYGNYFGGSSTSAILRVNSQGQVVQVIPVPEDTLESINGVELDPINNMLYAAITTSFNGYGGPGSGSVDGELVEFNPITGALVATIPLPVDNSNYYYYYPDGFSIDPNGNFWIEQPNSQNIIELNSSYVEVASYSTAGITPESATLGTDGNVYFSGYNGPEGNGIYQLNPSTGAINYFASSPAPQLTTVAPGGAGIWDGDYYDGALLFNSSGTEVQQNGFYGTVQAQTDQNGNVWVGNYYYGQLDKYDPDGNEVSSTFVPGVGGLTIWGVDNPNPPAQDSQDYYSFSLTQGQTATAVVESLNGKAAQISIVDGNGNVLASGVSGATNVSQAIENFTAPSTGTYYVEITGDPNLQYSVVVTRGADFTLQPHNSISTAQNITGTGGVLGYLAQPSAPLYTLDDNFESQLPIWQTDPNTGAYIGSPIYTPVNSSSGAGPYGLNLAFDGTNLYFNAGEFDGNNTIYELNATTGAVITTIQPASSVPPLTGIAWFDGHLWGSTAYASNDSTISNTIYEFDASGNVINSFATGITDGLLEGLAGDPDDGVLWTVTQTTTGAFGGTIYEIDPTTGAILESLKDSSTGYEQDIGYYNHQLFVSDAYSGPGTNFLDVYNTSPLSFVKQLSTAATGYISGVGADGLGGAAKDDWYSVNVQAGQSLYIQSSTPSDQGGQFPNTASLEISVYDTYGNLVAQGTKDADGRNESLFFNAPVSGNYKIDITEDPGGAGEYFLQVNTASYASGGITGQVFNDLTGSGTYATGDPGLANWEVDLFDANDNFVASQLTDANGDFDFEGLEPGSYTVEEFVQAGWTQTAPPPPGTFTVTVTAGAVVSGLQFGNFQDINITGQLYDDLNENGMEDAGEPGLVGWTVDLLDSNGNLLATTTSDVNGDYGFTDLGPGTYTVEEVLPAGWIQTQPAPPGTYTVPAISGQDATGLLFGNYELVTYTGTVYDDLNGSGVIAPNDPGLQGWTVELLDSNGNILETTTSASDGSYSFSGLGAGTYTIEEITQAGWFQTEPPSPFVYNVTATSGSSQSGLNFGNFQLVGVSGEVYNDLNGNGNLDPGEPGLQGWTVNLLNQAGNTVATTTSDANGDYEFDNLFPGNFIVEEVLQSGWIQTQPVNPNYYSFATQSGLNETGLNFGNKLIFTPITVSGNVYNDLDGNGLKGSGEPGLAGWTVDLEDSSGNVLASVLTDSNGNYAFTGVGGGSYEVAEVVQTGWVQTQPLYPVNYSFTSQSGTNLSALVFGDHAAPALSPLAVIDNGQPGYAETGSWSTVLGGFNGTNRVAKTLQPGGPPATASWTFTGLPTSTTYFVYITYAGKSMYSKAAPFSVNGGAATDINQSILVTQSQGGLSQGSYGGVGWLELGTYADSTTGQLQVVLSNAAAGNFVDADGVLIIPDGVAPGAIIAKSSPAGGGPGGLMGSVPALITSNGPTTGTPTVAISGATKSSGVVTVIYSSDPPAQASPTTSSIVDLALSQNSNSRTSSSSDAIGTLAADVAATKKTGA